MKKSAAGDLPSAALALHDDGGAGRERDRREIRRRVAVDERTSDRAAVADLRVAHEAGDVRQQGQMLLDDGRALDVAVAGQRSHGDVVARVAHVRQVGHAADVDQHTGRHEPQLHER